MSKKTSAAANASKDAATSRPEAINPLTEREPATPSSALKSSRRAPLSGVRRGYLGFAVNVDRATLRLIDEEVLPRAGSRTVRALVTRIRTRIVRRISSSQRSLDQMEQTGE
jgi:hypothetical protein